MANVRQQAAVLGLHHDNTPGMHYSLLAAFPVEPKTYSWPKADHRIVSQFDR
jgi:hypothetical protein